jgi:periplasmic mercuric ion binding protein
MKAFKIVSLLPVFMALAIVSFAQKTTTESIPVSGNCGMCKTTIEKAAKKAGASSASWSADTKVLTITYSNSTTNAAKIQQGISAAGYDTRDFKTTDAAYNKLPACCQYDRDETKETKNMGDVKCVMKDGKCADMASCKDKGCCTADGVCMAANHEKGHDEKAGCCRKSQ